MYTYIYLHIYIYIYEYLHIYFYIVAKGHVRTIHVAVGVAVVRVAVASLCAQDAVELAECSGAKLRRLVKATYAAAIREQRKRSFRSCF